MFILNFTIGMLWEIIGSKMNSNEVAIHFEKDTHPGGLSFYFRCFWH